MSRMQRYIRDIDRGMCQRYVELDMCSTACEARKGTVSRSREKLDDATLYTLDVDWRKAAQQRKAPFNTNPRN